MDTLLQDIRYAIRVMRKSPGFTLVAAFTIALGIGANTTTFSAINATVINPFTFPTRDRLVALWESNDEIGIRRGSVAPANFNDWREQNQTLEKTVAISQSYFDFSESGPPDRFAGYMVSADFFEALGVRPLYGRTFTPEEDQPGNNQVVVLSYGFWQRRFGQDPAIVNQRVTINGKSYTVIGVMPEGFNYPFNGGEMWSPLAFTPKELADRNNHFMQVIGLVREGTSIEQVRSDLAAIALRAQQQFPDTNSGKSVNVLTIAEDATRGARMYTPVIFASVGFVLLIACANVANLLLARGTLRKKEVAIRLAVGATRWRLVRQLLTESLMLAIIGGALGLLFSLGGVKALANGIPEGFSKYIPGWNNFKIDRTVFIFTLGISVLTGLLFGLIPAFQSTKAHLNEALKEGGRSSGKGLRSRTRSALVVSEIALTMILLTSAALTIQSFINILNTDKGVRPAGVLTARVSLPNEKYDSEEKRISAFREMVNRVSSLPGVTSAAAVSTLPMNGSNNSSNLKSVGLRTFEQGKQPYVNYHSATAGYFQAIGTTIKAGRDFDEKDQAGSERVALVDEAFANKYLPGEYPIGQRFVLGDRTMEIIGVTANIMNDDFDNMSEPNIYVPHAQEGWRTMYLVIRSDVDPSSLVAGVRSEVGAIDDSLPVFNVSLMQQLINERMSPKRLLTILLGIFALIALALAVVGIYAVISYSVSQRTHEIGIRLALGAHPRNVLSMVVGQGLKLTLAGIVIGALGAFAMARVMGGLLYGISATDPATFAGIGLMLAGSALGASFVPARRATRVDPMIALRYE